MTKRKTCLIAVMAITGSIGGILAGGDDGYPVSYEVTITNITTGAGGASGQILNGLVVATHNSNFRLFTLGQPVGAELALIAEDALNADLVAALSVDPDVLDVQTIGIVAPPIIFPILPGDSASVVVSSDRRHRLLSLGDHAGHHE